MTANEFQDSFVRALTHLEKTLTASHIAAFPVWCCSPTDDVAKVRIDVAIDKLDFSYVPTLPKNAAPIPKSKCELCGNSGSSSTPSVASPKFESRGQIRCPR